MTTAVEKHFENRTPGMSKWRGAEGHPNGVSAYNYILPLDEMPDLGATSEEEDPLLKVKLFDPTGGWTWYLVEFDGEDIAFGWVDGFEFEGGSISLRELAAQRGRFGLPIERDLHWTPKRLSEVKK